MAVNMAVKIRFAAGPETVASTSNSTNGSTVRSALRFGREPLVLVF
jgi:hypothetical protein